MLKTKIYAGSIENLTDARYFAAWYVDYMGFNLEKCILGDILIQEIAAIKEWVDVQEFVAEFSGLEDPRTILDLSNELNINTIKVGPFCPISSLEALEGKHIFKELIFNSKTTLLKLKTQMENEHDFVDYFILKIQNIDQMKELEENFQDLQLYFDLYDMKSFIEEGYMEEAMCEGVVVHGGVEEQTGFKSFEELDEIYEILF